MTVHEMKHAASDSARLEAVGGRLSRVDGPAKITGAAHYAVEQQLEGLAHAVLVGATIAAGKVTAIDARAAETAPGMLAVLTPDTIMELKGASDWLGNPPSQPTYAPLAREVTFSGQHVAAVVAETFEQAVAAAELVKVSYDEIPAIVDLSDGTDGIPIDAMTKEWGDAEAAFAAATVRVCAAYNTPREFQAAMEPHGLIARWEGDQLTIWEPSQWLDGMARTYAEWFSVPFENVRLVSPYIGGGFGSKALALAHSAVAAAAAKMLNRPVKLVLNRPQNFTSYGGRAATRQTVAIGADTNGRIQSIVHRGVNETAVDGMWVEPLGSVTSIMYATPNFSSKQNVVRVNTVVPGAKRAPGENPSAFGIECAIDELAYELGIDPLEMRLINYAEQDPHAKKAWSTRQLREAFAAGAEAFGWAKRSPQPRSMRDGHQLIGWGLAAGTYPVRRAHGEAVVKILADGSAEVESSSIDMGQGTYTILAQTAAETLGVPVEQVSVKLGDSHFARAGVTGGSRLAGVMTGAVHKAAGQALDELIGLALSDPHSPFKGLQANTLQVKNGRIASPRGEGPELTIAELMSALGRERIEAKGDTMPANATPQERYKNYTTIAMALPHTEGDYSRHSWCAHFVEVRVDRDFGTVRVSRVVSALDSGRLYNPKLAESQWKGGIIMGIGQALLEEGIVDRRHGRIVNGNLADYMLPTNADIPDIQTISVGIPDPHSSALGGKGAGELGIVGVAPAIANAVFHATGKRVRDLPITLEKLI
ncbi:MULTISPECIES: xanthine dehydrogenase family protein molybdopterin-binding subunit [unclassified Mesorhizobium]|uniref:xanthine dehydrogenase family protein molybdopterin-binding subunit n=2 Tax=Mesorhizobium TaxID=68287 RepID=UPI000BAF593D|nr:MULTISPECIES: xanthine dehydrogenase family protein molybdopterin-binding subunit [unclassified Mesorhizobium]TGT56914.1 xanthine dehydrogenase family protein molybdopterin-binding subunit [Mesorhizobium sp. M00.F.Ca.ET.170.01.1.1]AZO08684.1 xanthine dehydrogenase family protein molybdopterin-binding subunit [Mesorhizobium sp. M3A.F.Ca.ET.080.04.2.1]PBB85563.1 oxidoreductase [Mesorhizobium sp. WSM3876]RWB71800.1 MAG: xanthine dehydrogenase family protein molybdopterin-binding subunit [Mesorh